MANVANLIVKVKANSSSLTRGLSSSKRRVKRFETSTLKSFSRIRLGAIAAAAGITAAFGKAFTTGVTFSESIANLTAITGAGASDIKLLSDAAKEFGKTTTLSATQVADAFTQVASARPELLKMPKALIATTKEVVALAEASGTSVPQAAQIVGESLNQFGVSSKQAARFVNVLAAGAQKGSSFVEETGMALREAGLAAKEAGLSFEQTNAALQILAKNGIKSAKAGVALRNALIILDTDIDRNLRPSVVGFEQALSNLADKNLDASEMVKLFGRETINAGRALLGGISDISAMEKAITGTGTAYEQAKIKQDAFSGRMKSLSSSIEGLTLTAFARMEPALTKMVDGLVNATRMIERNIQTFSNLGKLIGAGGTILVGMKLLPLAVGVATKSFKALNVSLFITQKSLMGVSTSVLSVKRAFLGLIPVILGWQVGTFLRNEFKSVRIAALSFIGSFMEGMENVKFAAKSGALLFSNSFSLAFEEISIRFGKFLDFFGGGLSKIPGFKKAGNDVLAYGESLKKGTGVAKDFTKKIGELGDKRDTEISKIQDNIMGLQQYDGVVGGINKSTNDMAESTRKAASSVKGLSNAMSTLGGGSAGGAGIGGAGAGFNGKKINSGIGGNLTAIADRDRSIQGQKDILRRGGGTVRGGSQFETELERIARGHLDQARVINARLDALAAPGKALAELQKARERQIAHGEQLASGSPKFSNISIGSQPSISNGTQQMFKGEITIKVSASNDAVVEEVIASPDLKATIERVNSNNLRNVARQVRR